MLGLENHATEIDVSIYSDPGSCFASQQGCQPEIATPSQAILSNQARVYRELFTRLAQHASVTSVTTWGVSDAQTWLNNFPVPGRDNHPLLFDRQRAEKTALHAVADPNFVIP
jgi:endo-1,4-beta-xylanase